MSVPRPLPKALLKKMFLKILHEHRRGGAYENHGHDWYGIIQTKVQEYFHLDSKLSEQERGDGYRAVYELERDGFIMQDQSQSSESFKVLTGRGQAALADDLEEIVLPSIDIDAILTNEALRDRVHDDFLLGDYEGCVFKAFRLLEEKVRGKTLQPPTLLGAELMSRAFREGNGLLKHPGALTSAEEQGLHHLMRGAIMLFKNPSSHRTVEYADEFQAAYVLCFANLLLNMTDEAIERDHA